MSGWAVLCVRPWHGLVEGWSVGAQQPADTTAPPGSTLRRAVVEDTYEVLAGLEVARVAVLLAPGDQPDVEDLLWPGTPVLRLPDRASDLAAAAALPDAEAVVLVAADVPDLPPLLLGKVFRGLAAADVAVCPAQGGGLVALGSRVPVPAWLYDAGVGLDDADALDRLAAGAPTRRALSVGPGWHRLRTARDMSRLDPGLEGWELTRACLA